MRDFPVDEVDNSSLRLQDRFFFNDAKLASSEYRKDRGYSLAQRLRIALENFRNEAAQDRSGKTQKDQSGS
jgi:hypothetical protein